MTDPGFTRPLDALTRSDEPAFGGKSASLGELISAGIPVPPGFALSTGAFEAFMSGSGLETVVDEALAGVALSDPGAVGRAADAIAFAMRAVPVPDAIGDEIARAYQRLGGEDPPVAVRSSAVGEDSAQATFAGQQETYLWVRGADDVCTAVRDCWASLYSAPAISYRAKLGERSRPAMGVTIQLMVDAEISGVMFTCNPVSGDPSMVALNASWGLGLAVVGGEVTPDDFLVSKITNEVVRERVNTKAVQYVPRANGHGAERVEVPADRRDVACLDHDALAALVRVARRVQDHFGSHQDIEWAIDRGGEVFVVQSRPVTTVGQVKPKTEPKSALSMVMGTFGAGGKDGP